MIQKFVDRFMARRCEVEARFREKHVKEYKDVVRIVVEVLRNDEYGEMDPKRIHEIDDGHYQGTKVFVIACTGYQPDIYYAVAVDYGSCSLCDLLESIHNYGDGQPTDDQVRQYWTLALHVVQNLKMIDKAEPAQ